MELHLIERDKRFTREDRSTQDWQSGFWKFSASQAREFEQESADVYFHTTQTGPSYFGGIVTGYKLCTEGERAAEGRGIIHFTADMAHKGVETDKEGWSFWYKIVRKTQR